MKYLTEYQKEDEMYGGEVYAQNWEEAEKLARQKGEIVIGYIPPSCINCINYGELREPV